MHRTYGRQVIEKERARPSADKPILSAAGHELHHDYRIRSKYWSRLPLEVRQARSKVSSERAYFIRNVAPKLIRRHLLRALNKHLTTSI